MMSEKKLKIDISFYTLAKIIGSLLLIYFLFIIRDILALLIVSFIFSAALEPTVDKIQRKTKLPRWTGVLFLYMLFIGIIYSFISVVYPVIEKEVISLIARRDQYFEIITSTFSSLPDTYQSQLESAINNIPQMLSRWEGGIFAGITGFVSVLTAVAIVLVVSFYILNLKNGMNKTISVFVPKKHRDFFISTFEKIVVKMSQWFKGQLILSLAVAVLTYIGLRIIGVPYASLLAVFAGFMELIPIIGPFLGAIPAILITLVIDPVTAIIVALYYILVQQLENHVLVPQVMRRALGLNPIIVIISMLIGAKLLGIIGIIIAIPTVSAINVVYQERNKLKEEKVGN